MLALCKCLLIVIATIQNNDKYCPVYSSAILQNDLMFKIYAEITPWRTQAQQATTDGHTELNVTFLRTPQK